MDKGQYNGYLVGNNFRLMMLKPLMALRDGNDSALAENLAFLEENLTNQTINPYKKSVEYKAVGMVAMFSQVAMEKETDPYMVMTIVNYYYQRISEAAHTSMIIAYTKEAYMKFLKEIRKAKEENTESLLAKKAKHFIRANLTTDFHLEDVARYVGVSPTYLSNSFTETEGLSLKQYFLKERILAAMTLLRETGKPVGEIAEAVGFCTQSHFNATFKRLTGMTPLEYRKNKTNILLEF